MITVILAGGQGSRLSEYTNMIPKPMVEICGVPILLRIIKHYNQYGFNKFIIATGYKKEIIDMYFRNNNKKFSNLEIKPIFTGKNSLTGTRVKKLSKYLKDDNFFLTYGDGLSSVNIKKLYEFHLKNKKLLTMTAVHPPARFGELMLVKNAVKNFEEKPQLQKGWINGGFFVLEPEVADYVFSASEPFESGALPRLVEEKQLMTYQHEGFWQPMDTLREKQELTRLAFENPPPWLAGIKK